MHLNILYVDIDYIFYITTSSMETNLNIHELSLEHIDQLIQETRSKLSEEEKKAFTDELNTTDQEYMNDIQILIDKKLRD